MAKKKRISNKKISLSLLIDILVFSTFVTLITTAISMYVDYSNEMKIIEERLLNIEKSYQENISHSLWYLDEKATESLMTGILQLPDIQYLGISSKLQNDYYSAGTLPSGNTLSYDFPLLYTFDEEELDLGSLQIVVNLDNVYERLLNRLLIIFGTKAIEIFLISAFLFFIVQRLITRHLTEISHYVRKLNHSEPGIPLKLDQSKKGRNELNHVVDAINAMNSDLHSKIDDLRDSEEKFRTIIESSADAIFITDRNGCYVYVNQRAADILDYTVDELTEMNIVDVSLEERIPMEKQNFKAVLEGDVLFTETFLKRKDGSSVPVDLNVVLLPNGLVFGSCRDISKRKNSEMELKRLQNYLSNIINSMPSIIIGIDARERVTQWNKRAEATTGLPAGKALGNELSEVFPQRPTDLENIRESIRTKQIKTEFNRPNPTEEGLRYENYTIYPLVTNGVEGAVIRIDDVTKEYKMIEQLNQSQKLEAVGQLAGGMAHDFNNMLTGIMSAAHLLKSPKLELNGKSLKYVDLILTASDRAAALTAKLLQFGRKENLALTDINLHSILDDAMAIFNSTFDKKIQIAVKKESEDFLVIGDGSAIQNAIMNLGINASHAMPDGGRIEIETRNTWLDKGYCDSSPFDIIPGKYNEIEIRDSGTGIPSENISKIFDPFFTTKEQGEGTGLGLSSVYSTVKFHHGAITVYSEEGTGTVFHMYLPCSHINNTESLPDHKPVSGTGTILLVDDEDILRITGQSILEELGYEAVLAANGREALELYKHSGHRFDLVILDMVMPEMNGTETFCKLKEYDQNCQVIVASGFTKDENLDGMREMGLAGFIRKPFRISELSKMISDVLQRE